nr:hypothetical protein [Tanacetum cinerariifolium]
MKQMLLAKKDKAGVILFNEQNDFLIADSSQLKEIEELSANVCMMARIQPANIDSDEGPGYDSVFISETSPSKKKHVNKNTKVIALVMYMVNTASKQEVRTQNTKSILTFIGLKDVTSVRRPSSRGLSSKNSVLSNTKNHSKYGEVHVRTDKRTNVTCKKNVVQTKKIVTNIDVKDALKAKDEGEGMNIPDWMLHEHYHGVENDEVVKLIFNSRKNKEGEGMNIPDWMLMKEMKHTTHYQMIPISPRTPNPNITEGGSSAPRKPTIIRQIVEGNENVDIDEFMDEIVNNQEDLGTRLEPSSDKKSPKVKKSADILIIHDDEEEEESAGDALIRRKGKGIDDIRDTPRATPIRSPKTHIAPISSDKETLQELTASVQDTPLFLDKEKVHELTVTDPTPSSSTPPYSTSKPKKDQFCEMAAELKSTMKQVLPLMVDERVNEIVTKTVPLYVAKELLLDKQKTQTDMATMIAEAIQKERETIRAELSTMVTNGMESYQLKVNLTAPTITFPSSEKKKLLTIILKPIVRLIYKNSKKEKRVMILKEIPKFYDATLKRVLEMVKKFNKDIKYGYVSPSPTDADAEYLELYEEYIKNDVKHCDQMRHWEMYVNGRPLGSRMGRPK